jgi:hypothetical protein
MLEGQSMSVIRTLSNISRPSISSNPAIPKSARSPGSSSFEGRISHLSIVVLVLYHEGMRLLRSLGSWSLGHEAPNLLVFVFVLQRDCSATLLPARAPCHAPPQPLPPPAEQRLDQESHNRSPWSRRPRQPSYSPAWVPVPVPVLALSICLGSCLGSWRFFFEFSILTTPLSKIHTPPCYQHEDVLLRPPPYAGGSGHRLSEGDFIISINSITIPPQDRSWRSEDGDKPGSCQTCHNTPSH